MKNKTVAGALLTLFVSTFANAETDGVIGSSSTGGASISANLINTPEPQISVSVNRDFILPDVVIGSRETVSSSNQLCIHSINPRHTLPSYHIEVFAPHMNSDQNQHNISYSLQFHTFYQNRSMSTHYVNSGSDPYIFNFWSSVFENCTDYTHVFVHLRLIEAAHVPLDASLGTYSATLTFIVSPV